MSRFRYQALDSQRVPQNGEMEGTSEQQVAQQLQRQGWLVLSVRPARGITRHARPRTVLKPALLVNITQQLATLLTAGQPLARALTTLIRQQSSAQARDVLDRVLQRVKGGMPFSQALEREPGQFSTLYRSMVSAGEASGALHNTLQQLADYLERSHKLRAGIINALIYPAFLIVGVLGSLVLLLAFVIPQFVPVFQDMGVEIPTITRVILWLGDACNAYGLPALAALVGLMLFAARQMRHPPRRQRVDRKLLTLPVLGRLIRQTEAARISRTLGTLLTNGVALLPALRIVERVGSNQALAAQLRQAAEQVKAGRALSVTLNEPCLLPELMIEMIAVGEASGKLDAMLLQVADIFDSEAKRGIERLMAAFTPVLTLVMALLVMVIMLAVMLPLMSLTNNI